MGDVTVWTPRGSVTGPGPLVIEGDEAKHAVRVRRVAPGDGVLLADGHGLRAQATVLDAGRTLTLEVIEIDEAPRVSPRLEVWAATPKGQRLDKMIDQLSQVGAAVWVPLHTDFGVVEPGGTKLDRLGRIAAEAAKQCGRPWMLEIDPIRTLDEALDRSNKHSTLIILADADGMNPTHGLMPSEHETIRLLVGPEGGFSPTELSRIQEAGVASVCLGPHVMRIETAAVVGASALLNAARAGAVGRDNPPADE